MAVKNPSWDHAKVAAAVIAARDATNMTQDDFCVMAGISVSTLRDLEQATGRRTRQSTLARLEAALGWQAGTIAKIAQGEPVPATQEETMLSRLDALEQTVDYLQDQLRLVLREVARRGRTD